MPRDLFTHDSVPAARRTRRSSLLIVSVTAHIIAVAAVLLASILLPDVLPRPRAATLEWDPTARMVTLDDIPLPPPVHRPLTAPAPVEGAAPIAAPDGFTAEESNLPPLPGPTVGLVQGDDVGETLIPPPPPPPLVDRTAAKQREPVRVSGGVAAPRKTLDVAPSYPPLARAAGAQGLVIIEATIDTSGSVIATKVLRSAPLLDAAAVEAVRQWRYEPARLNGEPVAVLITVTVNFVLGR